MAVVSTFAFGFITLPLVLYPTLRPINVRYFKVQSPSRATEGFVAIVSPLRPMTHFLPQ
jgi:hypothetical protein